MINKTQFGAKLNIIFSNQQINRLKFILPIQIKDLQRVNLPCIDVESDRCPYDMKALYTRSSRIDYQHITFRVTYNLQNMRMPAYENIRLQLINKPASSYIIPPRISSDMSHKHLHALTFEEAVKGMGEAEIVVVTVAGDTYKGFELSDSGSKVEASAEIAGVPDLVHRGEKFTEFGAEDAVGV